MKLMTHSEKMEVVLEGKASKESLHHKELGVDEFFSVLRTHRILHLGQVKAGILETSGEVSLLLYDDDARPGYVNHSFTESTKQ